MAPNRNATVSTTYLICNEKICFSKSNLTKSYSKTENLINKNKKALEEQVSFFFSLFYNHLFFFVDVADCRENIWGLEYDKRTTRENFGWETRKRERNQIE